MSRGTAKPTQKRRKLPATPNVSFKTVVRSLCAHTMTD
jgi:hypothetical protein